MTRLVPSKHSFHFSLHGLILGMSIVKLSLASSSCSGQSLMSKQTIDFHLHFGLLLLSHGRCPILSRQSRFGFGLSHSFFC